MSKVCGKCVYYRACEANGFEACYGDSDYAQGCKSYRAQREHQPDPCAAVDKKKTGKKERGNKKVGAKKGKKPKRKKPEQKGSKRFIFINVDPRCIENQKPLCDIDPADIARLAMIGVSQLQRDTGSLNKGGNMRWPMCKKDFVDKLGVSDSTFLRLWNAGYIIGDDNKGYRFALHNTYTPNKGGENVHVDLMWNGCLGYETQWHCYQKLYRDVYWSLYHKGVVAKSDGSYRSIKTTDHRAIGRLLLLAPYIHRVENVLCHNPFETDRRLIRPLSSEDIARILGSKVENAVRDIKKMMDLAVMMPCTELRQGVKDNGRVVNETVEVYRPVHMLVSHTTGGSKVYIISPTLLYYGSDESYCELLEKQWMNDPLSGMHDEIVPAVGN